MYGAFHAIGRTVLSLLSRLCLLTCHPSHSQLPFFRNRRCLASYWNGTFFSHAVMNYYRTNPNLCGKFDLSHVDWNKRVLSTPTGYSTHWFLPVEVQQLLRSYDVDVDCFEDRPVYGKDHINMDGLCIFVWFSEACTSRAKGYYDSDDAQKFYHSIWGEETVHIGRYDLLTEQDKAKLTKQQQIRRAQELHEAEFMKVIHSKFAACQPQVRILDMGTGYGGLLRRLWEAGMVWSGVGVDIAAKMCEQNRRLNIQYGCDRDIAVLEESYLDVSVADESVDLVISMDALLHVGPEGQRKAIKEAARVLRPGGWMIFTDIMQQEQVDAAEMQPIYDRIHLSQLGTVRNYKDVMELVGFTGFTFEPHSTNVPAHYGTVREVLMEKGDSIGVSKEYATKMEAGLRIWQDLGPKNILWGFTMAQKTKKVSLAE